MRKERPKIDEAITKIAEDKGYKILESREKNMPAGSGNWPIKIYGVTIKIWSLILIISIVYL